MSEQTPEQIVEELQNVDVEQFLLDHPQLEEDPVVRELMSIIMTQATNEGMTMGTVMAFTLMKDHLNKVYRSDFYEKLSGSSRMAANVALGYVETYIDTMLSYYDTIEGEENDAAT